MVISYGKNQISPGLGYIDMEYHLNAYMKIVSKQKWRLSLVNGPHDDKFRSRHKETLASTIMAGLSAAVPEASIDLTWYLWELSLCSSPKTSSK